MTFEQADLTAIAQAEEVRIETHGADGTTHRTIIWIVEHDGELYIRSVNGPSARWYREATADTSVALLVGDRRYEAQLVPATDPASIEACSAGLKAKYRGDHSLGSMLEADTLPTTLRVVPMVPA
ncbi:MAG TPA: DUF2255 family protein [Candidatus Limnocylindrales bacterium]|nr:DUF2255 family protein [Candidatus Limnocylindrales bacterium]